MSLIEIKVFKASQTNSTAYVNPDHIIAIQKSDITNNNIWYVSLINGDKMIVDQDNLNIILDHNKSIIASIFT